MDFSVVEKNYQVLSKIVNIIKKDHNISYLMAIIETLNILYDKNIYDNLDKKENLELHELYDELTVSSMDSEQIRRVIQLLILNSYKIESISLNDQITPDFTGLLILFLINNILDDVNQLSILDITVGSGNLISVILNGLKKRKVNNLKAYGIDNNKKLLDIADISSLLQNNNMILYHQDAIDNFLFPEVDLIVSDLPVGYYPIDQKVINFKTCRDSGHSYVHYLLIERGLYHLKQNGWAFFIVPSNIFSDKKSIKLLQFIQTIGYFQGLLNLPDNLFNSFKFRKSILIVQKKGNNSKQASNILLGDFPKTNDIQNFQKFLDKTKLWINNDLYR